MSLLHSFIVTLFATGLGSGLYARYYDNTDVAWKTCPSSACGRRTGNQNDRRPSASRRRACSTTTGWIHSCCCFLSSEVLHTLVGSFGLVTVAPFTALVSGFLFVRKG